jgi:CubicO group peptidase (beta-lactamase class C family)
MDAQKLQGAVDYALSEGAVGFRVYRHGCLVAENASASEGTTLRTQSWSMAKGVSSVVFGRAWTLGLIGPDDPVGSLYPEADRSHGKRTLRDLLSMAFGNSQTLLHDFNILMDDRIRDGLTIPLIHPRGEFFNYWQSGPPLTDEAIARAAGMDFQAFVQRELFGRLGISVDRWGWQRDPQGHTQGFFGLFMSPDDYGRLGDLMRRDGVWRGERLLSRRYLREAVTPTSAFGCYGWYLWVHASIPCDGRSGEANLKGWDPRFFEFNGLNQQLISVFPASDVVMVRVGDKCDCARKLYEHVLGAVIDDPPPMPNLATDDDPEPFRITPAGQSADSASLPPLPPAGPARARAVQINSVSTTSDSNGTFAVALHCPPRMPDTQPSCAGRATATGTRKGLKFDVPPGADRQLRFRLTSRVWRKLRRKRTTLVKVAATTRDATTTGTKARLTFSVAAPDR